jgi:ribosomal protein S18 acetylase RimI-like enzyme
VGFADEVSYTGPSPIKIGTDHDAYPQALREILNVWVEDTITSLIIALSLAAPIIARQQPRRNPAIYLHGGSNSGKTTLIQFATGVWGDPMQRPIRLEGSSSTRVSILQTLTQLSGLPLFIDEIHTTLHPADVESTVYNFANGQARSTGGVNGTPNGGGTLHGALFLAGEALTEFKYAGSANRTLMVSADMYWPLCAAKGTREGQHRAEMLEHAWKVGAGTFGPRTAEAVWRDWTAFTRRVAELRVDPAIIHIPAWSDSLAIAAALLEIIAPQIELDTYEYTEQALQTWAELLIAGRVEHDPAADAFDQVKLLIAQGEQYALNNTNTPTPLYRPTPEGDWEQVPWAEWETRSIGRQIVAYRKVNEQEWRVPTSTLQFKERVGEQSVQLHGRLWVHKGWIKPDKYGKATQIKKIPGGGAMRCVIVPDALIQGEGEAEGRAT